MDDQEREQIQHTFETWNRETLLEELVQRGDDFVPEARELLEAELERRGVTSAAIDRARQAYRDAMNERKLPLEALVTLETFGDQILAGAAQEVLHRNGVDSEVFGSNRMLFGSGLLAVGPDPIVLKVAEHDAEKAREILRELEEVEADDGEEE